MNTFGASPIRTSIGSDLVRQIRTGAVGGGGGRAGGSGNMTTGYTNTLHPASQIPLDDMASVISANMAPYPDSVNVSVSSAPGAGAGKTAVNILQNILFGVDDDNGSGPGSITYTWDDNAGGNIISALLREAREGKGGIMFGFSVQSFVDAGAGPVAYPQGNATMKPAFTWRDWQGNSIPLALNTNSDNTKGTFAPNISVARFIANCNETGQLRFSINGDNAGNTYTLDLCLYFTKNFPF